MARGIVSDDANTQLGGPPRSRCQRGRPGPTDHRRVRDVNLGSARSRTRVAHRFAIGRRAGISHSSSLTKPHGKLPRQHLVSGQARANQLRNAELLRRALGELISEVVSALIGASHHGAITEHRGADVAGTRVRRKPQDVSGSTLVV